MCFIRPYVGGCLIHQIEVEKLEAFHSDFAWCSCSFEYLYHCLNPIHFLKSAKRWRRINQNAQQSI